MEAHERRIQKVLEGNKQFLVPHYQRPYTWSKDDWNTLWGVSRNFERTQMLHRTS